MKFTLTYLLLLHLLAQWSTCFSLPAAPAMTTPTTPPTPATVATAVGNSLVHFASTFINWEGGFQYGGAVTAEGLAQAASLVDPTTRLTWTSTLDHYLNLYLRNDTTNAVPCDQRQPYGAATHTRSCAWSLYHNDALSPTSWELSTVGDSLGSFPLGYLKRYATRNGTAQDAAVALRTVTKYVYPFTHHLADMTFSRSGGCCRPPPTTGNQSPFLWADDQFMGLALMARLSTMDRVVDAATRKSFMDRAAGMQLHFATYLIDANDGVSFHGAYVDDNNNSRLFRSCCKWGRANGWGALSRVEILKAMDHSFPTHALRSEVLKEYQHFMASLRHYQSKDGRWHQVINETSTFLETSVTAMVLTALVEGVVHGWLARPEYTSTIQLAWDGLVRTVNLTSGAVSGVCQGTGIQPNLTGYATRGTDYMQSAPGGVGSVLMACRAMSDFLETNDEVKDTTADEEKDTTADEVKDTTAAVATPTPTTATTTTTTTTATLSNVALPLDQHGDPIITGEASVLRFNGTYYFYFNNWGPCPGIDCCATSGGCASCCFDTFPNYTKTCSNLHNGSDPYGLYHTVQAYSTTDFVHWHNLGVALPLASRSPGIEFRPSVVHNAHTGRFVMWYEDRTAGTGKGKGYSVATSATPSGPFVTIDHSVEMPGHGRIGDFNLFVDDDGVAYHVRTGFSLTRLNAEYTGPMALVSEFQLGGEGPTMFKRQGYYYITTGSGCCACVGGSSILVHSSNNVTGPWVTQGDVGSNPTHDPNDVHDPNKYVTKSQGSAVFDVGAHQWVYLGNQWNSGLKETPPGPRNHDLLYWGVMEFQSVSTVGAGESAAPVVQQFVWRDTVEIDVPRHGG